MSGKPAAAPNKASPQKGGKSMSAGMLLAMVIVLSVMLPPVLFVVLAMLPTYMARLTDMHPNRALTACVSGFNGVGVLFFLMELIRMPLSFPTVFKMLQDPVVLMIVLGASGFGWFLYLTIPPALSSFYVGQMERHLKELQDRQVHLVDEWGADVTK